MMCDTRQNYSKLFSKIPIKIEKQTAKTLHLYFPTTNTDNHVLRINTSKF